MVIVIVILGVLASAAFVGYQAVIDRSKEATAKATLSSLGREALAIAAFTTSSRPTLAHVQEALLWDAPGEEDPPPHLNWTAHDTPGGHSTGPTDIHYASTAAAAGLAWQHTTGKCTLVKVTYGTRHEWSGGSAAAACTGDAALALVS